MNVENNGPAFKRGNGSVRIPTGEGPKQTQVRGAGKVAGGRGHGKWIKSGSFQFSHRIPDSLPAELGKSIRVIGNR